MNFNERLTRLRKKNGWSQEELGFRLDVSRQTVSKWENGDTSPELKKLILLGDLFHVSLDYLIKGIEPEAGTSRESGSFEYKSSRTLWGLPLVHIVKGPGLTRAKGIVAVGKVSVGVVSLGLVSVGVVSLGLLSLGALSLGILALGLMSAGTFAMGSAAAVGALAWGDFAVGALASGDYALGAMALGKNIAIGDYARGFLAIGREAHGSVTVMDGEIFSSLSRQDFLGLVRTHLPNANRFAVKLMSLVFPQ